LRHAVSLLKPDLTEVGFETTELARRVAEAGQTGDQSTLPERLTLLVNYGQLVITTPDDRVAPAELPQLAGESELPLTVPGRLELPGGWVINVERVEGLSFELIAANPDPWQAYVKVDFVEELQVRPRRTGERFQPFGLGSHSAKIGDVMTNRKIPLVYRTLWPVVAGADHLLWLVGHSLDTRAALDPASDQALLLKVERRRSVDQSTID
jgi:tRNA(Ile)-lysidine synthase